MPRFPTAFLTAAVVGLSTLGAQAACYDPNTARDTFIGEWVAWVPANGATAQWEGTSYGRAQAIQTAKAQIASRVGNPMHSPVAAAAYAVMDAGGITAQAASTYGNADLDVGFDDAVSCWQGHLN